MRHKSERELFSVRPFLTRVKKTKKLKSQQKHITDEDELDFLESGNQCGFQINSLSYNNIMEGQVMLGCISAVKQFELIVSLPHRMVGSVPITNISKSYGTLLKKIAEGIEGHEDVADLQDLFPVGHFIMTQVKNIVAQADTPKKIMLTLSILPADVNVDLQTASFMKGSVLQCAVKSIEDHGYIIDPGITKIRSAFMPKRAALKSLGTIGIGSVMLCSVQEIEFDEDCGTGGLKIKVACFNKSICNSSLKIDEDLKISTLLPGTLLDATVMEVSEEGLLLASEDIHGFVCSEHLMDPCDSTSDYSLGDKVKARLLYVTNITHEMYFTLNQNICSAHIIKNPRQGLAIGQIIKEAKIFRHGKSGIYLKLPGNSLGFCSYQHLKDKANISMKKLRSTFAIGTASPCRVIQYSFIDQLFIVTLQESKLAEQVKTKDDLKITVVSQLELVVGQVVKVTVKMHTGKGMVVSLSQTVSGFVPSLHMTDSNMKHPEKKCPPGKIFKGRILKHDANGHGPILSLKSILVKSQLPIVQDYSSGNVGVITEGTIAKIYEKGFIVEFYGGSRGFLPLHNVPLGDTESTLASAFSEGQVIRCKVISTIEEEQKIMLSLKFTDDTKKAKRDKSDSNLKLGDLVSCQVKSVEESRVAVVVKRNPITINSYIPVSHIADDPALAQALHKSLKIGDVIKRAVVFRLQKSALVISMKPTIYHSAVCSKGKLGGKLRQGEIVPCVIETISKDKMIVSFMKGLHGMRGIIGKAYFAKTAIEDLSKIGLCVGQSLFVKCLKISHTGKPLLSTRLEDICPEKNSSFQLLHDFLMSEKLIKSSYTKTKGNKAKFANIQVGCQYKAKVVYKSNEGALVNILDLEVDGVVPTQLVDPEISLEIGKVIDVTILHTNFLHNCIELAARKNITKLCCRDNHGLKVGSLVTCEVLLPKWEFILCRVKSNLLCRQVVYLPSRRHMNDLKGRRSCYEIGKKVKVIIRYIDGEMVFGDFYHHSEGNTPLNIQEKIPLVKFKITAEEEELQFLGPNKDSYTVFDFNQKVKEQLERVLQVTKSKKSARRKKNLSFKEKIKILKEDNFSQVDDDVYWTLVLEERKQRKRLKKYGLTDKSKLQVTKRQREDSDGNGLDCKKTKLNDFEVKDASNMECHNKSVADAGVNCLQLKTKGFVWDADNDAPEEAGGSSSSEDECIVPDLQKKVTKLTKEEKLQLKVEKERRIRELELQRKDLDRLPQSSLDYEELLQKNPTSSCAWIQYISFHLEEAEVEKAREVANRALKAIPATKEDDRLAVWGALLRIEVMFGTNQTVEDSFQEAIKTNDEVKMSEAMAGIYADVNKMEEAEDLYKKMTKKYSHDMNIWIKAGSFLYSCRRLNEARTILDKSSLCLSKSDHVNVVNRFAQFEFKYGDPERGRTMFESILANFPKRIDIWNVYSDLLTKSKDIEGARNVLDRMTNLKLSIRQMRTVYKKLLNFEKKHGTPHTVEAIKVRIEDYVMSALKEED